MTSGTTGLSIIGYNANANGQVNVNTNAAFNANGSTTLGYTATAQGTLNIDGASATSTINNSLTVGESGAGIITVKNRGTLTTNGGAYVGKSSGSTGNVTIDTGGRWISSDTYSSIFVGYDAGATGTMTVDGSGSVFENAGSLVISHSGTGHSDDLQQRAGDGRWGDCDGH